MMWIRCVLRVALARHCRVEESVGEDGAAATGAGAAAGKGREGRLESGGRAVLVAGGKKSTLPPLFRRTRAVRSIGLPQLHAATMVRRGRRE